MNILKSEKKTDIINITKPKVIWALYDDAESSYKSAIKKFFDGEFIVYSIGINDVKFEKSDQYFYEKINLSLLNFDLIKQLKKLPHPNIIMASPPCESWSIADCDGRMFRGFDKDGNWIIKNHKHYENYNARANPVKRREFGQKEKGRIIGESTIGATIEIIKYFNPEIWMIENPLTSKTWEFQKKHWGFGKNAYMNNTYYSSYDSNFSAKPTIFKSNIKLDLKQKKIKGNKDHMARGSYSKRSSIPYELIKDIVNQFRKEIYDKQ